MPDSGDKSEKPRIITVGHTREDSEYVRLVISDEPRTGEDHNLQSQVLSKRPSIWWIKAIIWCFVAIVILLVFVKWGVPFIFEKVYDFFQYFELDTCKSIELFEFDCFRFFFQSCNGKPLPLVVQHSQ